MHLQNAMAWPVTVQVPPCDDSATTLTRRAEISIASVSVISDDVAGMSAVSPFESGEKLRVVGFEENVRLMARQAPVGGPFGGVVQGMPAGQVEEFLQAAIARDRAVQLQQIGDLAGCGRQADEQVDIADPASLRDLFRRVGRVDAIVSAAFLEAMEPVGMDATLAALEALEREQAAISRHWQLRLERARSGGRSVPAWEPPFSVRNMYDWESATERLALASLYRARREGRYDEMAALAPGAADLGAAFPAHPLTVVEFHPDVTFLDVKMARMDGLEALTKMVELIDADGFINGFSSITADSNADQALLYTGRAAMMLHGSWTYGGMSADGGDFVFDLRVLPGDVNRDGKVKVVYYTGGFRVSYAKGE